MNQTIWKQYDSRWGGKPYPSGSTVSGCGCGLLACTHVAMEQERYRDWTPDDLREWMVGQGFALRGQGTRWEGITETLKYIGHENVVRIYNDPMTEAWKELDKGRRIGVLLLDDSRAPDGRIFTTCGHYIAFTSYKTEGKKHYFYLKDSGGRNNSGWLCYETSIRGCIAKMWIVERVGAQVKTTKATSYRPKTPYTGYLPTKTVKKGSISTSVRYMKAFLNWCIDAGLGTGLIAGVKTTEAIRIYQKTYGLTVDGIFGAESRKKAKSIIDSHKVKKDTVPQKAVKWGKKIAGNNSWVYVVRHARKDATWECPICHDHKEGKTHGWNCIGFVGSCYRHGAGLSKMPCDNGGILSTKFANKMLTSGTTEAAEQFAKRNGYKWKAIKNGYKKIPATKLEAGDIVICFDKVGKSAEYKHVAMYVGSGYIVDATSTHGISKRKYSSLGTKPLLAMRYKEK